MGKAKGITKLIGIVGTFSTMAAPVAKKLAPVAKELAPTAKEMLNEKIKAKSAEAERERIYREQKHNGMVKIAALVFSLVSVVLSIIALKRSDIITSLIGLSAVITYFITLLYCLEIIEEKKHDTYRIVFIIADLLMAIVVGLLFF
jgi:hypothetical protein